MNDRRNRRDGDLLDVIGTEGFFISPTGWLIHIDQHITTVRRYPEACGLTTAYIKSVYAAHREQIGTEGPARDQILKEVLAAGWIRLRRRAPYWSVQTGRLDEQSLGWVHAWARQIREGIGGWVEIDPYVEVRLDGLEEGVQQCHPLNVLAGRAPKGVRLRFGTVTEAMENEGKRR